MGNPLNGRSIATKDDVELQGATEVGGLMFVPSEITTNPMNIGDKQYVRTGTAIPYDSTKHKSWIGSPIAHSMDIWNGIATFFAYNPTTDRMDLWQESNALAGLASRGNISKEVRSGQFREVAKIDMSTMGQYTDMTTINSGFNINISIGNIVIRPMLSHNLYIAAFVVYHSYNLTYSRVVVMKSHDGYAWSYLSTMENSSGNTTLALGCHNGFGVVIGGVSSSSLQMLVFDLNGNATQVATGAGTNAVLNRSIGVSPNYFFWSNNVDSNMKWLPVGLGTTFMTAANTAVSNPISQWNKITAGYQNGMYVMLYNYDAGADVSHLAYGANPAIAFTAPTLTSSGTISGWNGGIVPLRNGGWMYGHHTAAATKNSWYSTNGSTWTAIMNQTTTGGNCEPPVLIPEVYQNGYRDVYAVRQGKTVLTDTTAWMEGQHLRTVLCRSPITGTILKIQTGLNTTGATGYAAILRSTDDGVSYEVAYVAQLTATTPAGIVLRDMKFLNDRFVSWGAGGKVYHSNDDGVTWTVVTPTSFTTANSIFDMEYFGGKYYAAARFSTYNYAHTTDLTTWTPVNQGSVDLVGLATDGATLIMKPDSSNTQYWSTTGASGSWTSQSAQQSTYYANGQFVSLSYGNPMVVQTSAAGQASWSTVTQIRTVSGPSNLNDVYKRNYAYFDGYHYLVSPNPESVVRSTDLATWSSVMSFTVSYSSMSDLGDRLEINQYQRTGGMIGTIYRRDLPKYIGTKETVELNGAVGYMRTI